MKTILDRTTEERVVKGFAAPAGELHLSEQASPAPSAPAPALAPQPDVTARPTASTSRTT